MATASTNRSNAARARHTPAPAAPAPAPAKRGSGKSAPAPPETASADDARMRRLMRMDAEQLIALGVRCMADAEHAAAELKIIHELLAERCPGIANEESIVTPAGVYKRKISNAYTVREDLIPALRKRLGLTFGTYIDVTPIHSVPEDRMQPLIDLLGPAECKRFIHTEDKVRLTAKAQAALKDPDNPITTQLADAYEVTPRITHKITPAQQP